MYDIDFFMAVGAGKLDRDRNFRSQNQRQTALQLEATGRHLEESEGVRELNAALCMIEL